MVLEKMKKILIIGNQGYLGTRLTEYLIQRGYQITGIDTGFFKKGILTKLGLETTIDKDARYINEEDIKKYNVVILLAGISNDPFGHMTSEQIYNPTRDYAINIARLCKKLSIKFIYPSSCSVYGAASLNCLLDEESPTNPQTPYSLNKMQVEEGLSKIADHTFSPIALRFGTIYGMSPRIRFDVVINMLCGLATSSKKITLNSNGQAWRPHLHIDDACESIRCCIDWDTNFGKLTILNVGRNEDNCKVIDIAKIIHSNVNGSELIFLGSNVNDKKNELIKDRKIQDGVDTRTYKVSFDKIYKVLPDFKCSWDVERGIMSLLKDLEDIKLNKNIFNKKEFYRLQQIEHLHKENKINDDLFWIK
jgi:nucleoside-diphosphate-sugar epimerase